MSEIKEEFLKKSLKCNVIVYDEIDSTNNIAKKLAYDGIEDKTLIVANRQSMGRGRLGRSFLSPDGGIYLSIVLRPELSVEKTLKITSGAAVAVRRVISKYCNDAKIKWVNDIYISGKKVCGILTESATCSDGGLNYVIVGIGINVFGNCNDYGKELKDIVTTIEENSRLKLDKNVIITKVYEEVLNVYSKLEEFDSTMEEYKKHSLVLGKNVYALNGKEKRCINVIDIDNDGALVAIDCETREKVKISSGEVSIRFN